MPRMIACFPFMPVSLAPVKWANSTLASVDTATAPANPSQVLPGLMRGIILCLPISEAAAPQCCSTPRLDVHSREELRPLVCAQPVENALDFRPAPSPAGHHRSLAEASAHLRCEHPFDGAGTER